MITQVSKEVFTNTQGVSYSRLSKLAESPQAYLAGLADDPSSSAISLGSAVDILLTDSKRFDEEIYVMTANKPNSEMMLKFVEQYVLCGGNAEMAHNNSDFKISTEAVMKKFEKEGRAYYDALQAAGKRQILDADDMFKANQIVQQLQTNPFTRQYFIAGDGVDLIFQPHILWNLPFRSLVADGKIRAIQAKSVLDVIRIDHNKKVIQPIELKTGAESFMKSYWRYKRYLQGSMYTNALYSSIKREDLDLYKVDNIRFVYADTNMWYSPRIYKMTDDDVRKGQEGQPYRMLGNNPPSHFGYSKNFRVKGYTQLASELDWHKKMDLWEYSYDVYQSNGEVDIDAFVFKF